MDDQSISAMGAIAATTSKTAAIQSLEYAIIAPDAGRAPRTK